MEVTADEVALARSDADDLWHLGNQVLYRLCAEHPGHSEPGAVAAKIWLIGRAYAAPVERRRPQAGEPQTSDQFYAQFVVPGLQESSIDKDLGYLSTFSEPNSESLPSILAAHKNLTNLFKRLTGFNKRSLASKYLHFHRPELFFLYDSLAFAGLRAIAPHSRKVGVTGPSAHDPEYASFAVDLLGVRESLRSTFGSSLTPRELDRLLLRRAKSQ